MLIDNNTIKSALRADEKTVYMKTSIHHGRKGKNGRYEYQVFKSADYYKYLATVVTQRNETLNSKSFCKELSVISLFRGRLRSEL